MFPLEPWAKSEAGETKKIKDRLINRSKNIGTFAFKKDVCSIKNITPGPNATDDQQPAI
jgi:hypothetical protein